jgi:hypothetical protein
MVQSNYDNAFFVMTIETELAFGKRILGQLTQPATQLWP